MQRDFVRQSGTADGASVVLLETARDLLVSAAVGEMRCGAYLLFGNFQDQWYRWRE